MIEGAHIYLQSGLQHSRVMKAELAQYRTDSDLLGAFLSERTVAAITADVLQSTLFSDYQMWCGNNGLRPVSKRTFTEQLSERGYGQRKSGGDRFYTGLEQRR
jgi:putative DNA primase/helicase